MARTRELKSSSEACTTTTAAPLGDPRRQCVLASLRAADLAARMRTGPARTRRAVPAAAALLARGRAASSAIGAWDESSGFEDVGGGLLGSGMGDLREDGRVGVGGEDDAGVHEHLLHHLQLHPYRQR